MEPNKDRLKLWVQALRSGRFHQVRDSLVDFGREEDGYSDDENVRVGHCCLAVAIEVALENGFEYQGESIWGDGDGRPPEAVGRWFGVDDDPVIRDDAYGGEVRAVDANDKLQWDFEQIANSVEQHYKLLDES